MKLPELPYSSELIELKDEKDKTYIKDIIRKKWLLLTPEEWVRQHFITYLLLNLSYPASSIAIEKKVEINGMPKRFDILIYHKGSPAILVECKAPDVNLTIDVFHQACRYNTVLKAPIAVLTNGLQTITAHVNGDSIQFAKEVPRKEDW